MKVVVYNREIKRVANLHKNTLLETYYRTSNYVELKETLWFSRIKYNNNEYTVLFLNSHYQYHNIEHAKIELLQMFRKPLIVATI